MSKLTIGFSKAKGIKPLSWLIRCILREEFSHVYILVENSYTQLNEVYQASKGQVNTLLYSSFLNTNEVVREFHLTMEQDKKKSLIIWLKNQLGKDYSLLYLVLVGLKCLKIPFFKVKKDGESAYICSELAYRVLKSNAILDGKVINCNEDLISPKDMYQLMLTITGEK